MEYIIVAVICFILGAIYNSGSGRDKLDTQIMTHLKQGKRVIVCIDDEATIFEMFGNKIRISKAITSFQEEMTEDDGPYDLISGIANDSLDEKQD
jgi:hypothetical protein